MKNPSSEGEKKMKGSIGSLFPSPSSHAGGGEERRRSWRCPSSAEKKEFNSCSTRLRRKGGREGYKSIGPKREKSLIMNNRKMEVDMLLRCGRGARVG